MSVAQPPPVPTQATSPLPPVGTLVRPPDPPPIHPSTSRNHNPGSGTKKWKISLQPAGTRRAACPKCKTNFDRGDFRIGSASAGNKASFHMMCLDAALPPVEQMCGWDTLSEFEKGNARTLYASYRSIRGGDAEVQAPKRSRQERPTRSVQMQLPFATQAQAQAILVADLDARPEGADGTRSSASRSLLAEIHVPTLPATDALADEDSDLDAVDDLPPAEGDPLVNMAWWDMVS